MAAAGPGRGLMAEILGGLSLVMIAATALLATVLAMHYEAQQRDLLARALGVEAAAPAGGPSLASDAVWWQVTPGEAAVGRGAGTPPIDAESLRIAAAAGEAGSAILQAGSPWGEVRFAVPVAGGRRVAVARIPAAALPGGGAAPRLVVLVILLADAGIFIAFGASLLRGRVVVPLRRLAAAARALADGDGAVRAPVAGSRETAELATAFNEMTLALAARSDELEKAVVDLRRANREVRDAHAGLARAERLASVGRLAAGVAHEVGNPMGALLAFLELAGRDPGLSDASRGYLQRAGAQVERVRRILRQMLDFSRPEIRECVPFDLGVVAEETAELLQAQAERRSIALTVTREGEPPAALGDPAAVSQILLNLGLNALDAVDGAADPRIGLRVRAAELRTRAGEPRESARGRRRAGAVECEVSDNGPGVSEADRDRVFDPFFTTKPPGEGTGLGLSNALRLAEELGGTLELAAGVPGARFVLRLPAAQGEGDCGVRTGLQASALEGAPEPEGEPQA